MTSLPPNKINDAVEYLASLGAVRIERAIGTDPFHFDMMEVQTRGRYLYYEIIDKAKQSEESDKKDLKMLPKRPLNPIGSPFGFTTNDWITVAIQKEDINTLYVVMGLQFKSNYYDSNLLIQNIKAHFEKTIQSYNENNKEKINLKFDKLEAGYGGHIFNSIACSIIGSDIAIFDISNKNSNVMIELGVALTWGILILPIQEKSSPALPSDISGQTWIKYTESGKIILDENYSNKLEMMVKRTIAGKLDYYHNEISS